MALGAVTRSDLADPAPYTKTFFDLQLRFAHTVSALSGLPLARAILEYTNFYIRFGLGREFNPADPAWTEYLAGLQHANDPGDWTYRFHLAHSHGLSPLGIERRGQRLADLAALFDHVKRTVREPVRVVGASWLYNIEAYRRLFPASYLSTAHVLHGRFQHMPLWGQFVNRRGEIRESVKHRFLERLERQTSLDDLDRCFPFQVLSLEASAMEFYQFYGV